MVLARESMIFIG
jgi:hypothetical protein